MEIDLRSILISWHSDSFHSVSKYVYVRVFGQLTLYTYSTNKLSARFSSLELINSFYVHIIDSKVPWEFTETSY